MQRRARALITSDLVRSSQHRPNQIYKPVGLGDIRQVCLDVSIPIFCIGGINVDNLQQVIDAGAKRVVMVSALLKAHSIVDYARCGTDMLA